MTRSRRGFGAIRRLPSRRYQASYLGPDLVRYPAPRTFETREDAQGWLIAERRIAEGGDWAPPAARQQAASKGLTLREYAPPALRRRRIRGEPLKPRTLVLYEGLLDRVILPELGDVPIHTIGRADVEHWHDQLGHPTQRAHAYALLKSLFDQAIAEDRLPGTVNACRIRGAGVTRRQRAIRPASLDELRIIAQEIPARWQALILIAAWCGLRFGEVSELRRSDVDIVDGLLRVRRAVVRLNGAEIIGVPKSEAGVRDVAIPPHLLPALERHLNVHVGKATTALLFTARDGSGHHVTHGAFYTAFIPARKAAGRPDLRLHDLRHTAAVMAAQSGATLAELMSRLGHSTPQAALRYQHAAQGRDAEIARRLSIMAEGEAT